MNKQALVNLIEALNGYSICSIVYHSKPKLNVKDRNDKNRTLESVFGTRDIYKVSSSRYGIGFDYEAANNGRLEKNGFEASFQSQGNHFTHQSKSIVISSKGNQQLLVQVIKQKPKSVYYKMNNGQVEVVDYDLLKPFMPVEKEKVVLVEGIEKLEVRTLNIDSIVSMTIKGMKYSMMDELEVLGLD